MNLPLNDRLRPDGGAYVFAEVARRVSEYRKTHPHAALRLLGIGDVTLPLPAVVTDAMARAAAELSRKESFRGYAPDGGYPFLKDALAASYARRGVIRKTGEIYISDGAKSDCGNLLDLFQNCEIRTPIPTYPAYLHAAHMAGIPVTPIAASFAEDYLPTPEGLPQSASLIILCSPNNPTGIAYPRDLLADWVDYARKSGSVILFDSAYEAFLPPEGVHSIYEIAGAEECAIEIGSFSKSAGFTGVRCGWCVIPEALSPLGAMWQKRQAARFNGVSYVTQRGAEAALSEAGRAEIAKHIAHYQNNAHALAAELRAAGTPFVGGEASPYLWAKCPDGTTSWDYFTYLLETQHTVVTPGVGFGAAGEGYIRLSAF